MKTNIITLTLLSLMSLNLAFAQDRTTVTAQNSEISDNLDLRAVASIFGDSKDLEDFEYRLNNPKFQISNLDLNNDNQVDYLRVIETVEGNTHLIVIQSVLGRDLYQDIATVEVLKDRNNRIQVQVVGDVYMYGANYIYEPVYAYTPVIYTHFWVPQYRPYCSTWYWGYYPSYYVAWNPFPIFRYRNNINLWINFNHHYNYVTTRNCGVVYNNYWRGRRGNAYEIQYPNRSFSNRHNGYTNRHEYDQTRNIRTVGTNNESINSGIRSNYGSINSTRNHSVKESALSSNTRSDEGIKSIRSNQESNSVRSTNDFNTTQNNSIRTASDYSTTRNNSIRTASEYGNTRSNSVRSNATESTTGSSYGTTRYMGSGNSTRYEGNIRNSGVRDYSSGTTKGNDRGNVRSYAQNSVKSNNDRSYSGSSSSVRNAPSRNENSNYSNNRSSDSNRSSAMRSNSSNSISRSASVGSSSGRSSSGGNGRGNSRR